MTPRPGQLIFLRARVIAGPHPHGGYWCHLVDALGRAELPVRKHASMGAMTLPIMAHEAVMVECDEQLVLTSEAERELVTLFSGTQAPSVVAAEVNP